MKCAKLIVLLCHIAIFSQCLLDGNIEFIPAIVNDEIEPNTNYKICLTVDDYDSQIVTNGHNWIHSVVPEFDSGWDINTLDFALDQFGDEPDVCSNDGEWLWYEGLGGSLGQDGWGWYFDSQSTVGIPAGSLPLNGDPTDNFGDQDNCSRTFCFTVESTDCDAVTSFPAGSITIQVNPDSETGSWTFDAFCQDDIFEYSIASLNCCPEDPVLDPITENETICFDENTVALSSNEAPNGFEILWFSNVTGTDQIGTGQNYTPSSPGIYYVQFFHELCESDLIPAELIELEELSAIGNPECSGSNSEYDMQISVSGGSGNGYNVASSGFSVTQNGFTDFEISGITNETSLTITITDSDDCENIITFDGYDCGCPTVTAPSNPQNNVICFGANPNQISVNVPPPGFQIEWYTNDISSGSLLHTGENYTPTQAGIYYAFAVAIGDDDCISDGTAVELIELEELIITIDDSVCDSENFQYDYVITLSGGSENGYSVVAGSYVVMSNGNGSFTIQDIPSGSAVSVNASDGEDCQENTSLPPVDCPCPEIAEPTNPINAEICFGDVEEALSVTSPGSDVEINWYNSQTGGNSLGIGENFTPTNAGMYYAIAVSTTNTNCVSDAVAVELIEQPELTIQLTDTNCATDNLTYDYEIFISGGTNSGFVIDAEGYIVQNNGNGNYTIEDILSNVGLTVNVEDDNDCDGFVILPPIDCGCPEIAEPTNPINAEICFGDVEEALSVTSPGSDVEINWYNSQTGGNSLGMGENFTPTTAGMYYAIAVSTTNTDCVSDAVAVELIEQPELTIQITDTNCATDNLTYDYEIFISGGTNSGFVIDAEGYIVQNNGNGNYTIEDILSNLGLTVNVEDDNDCDGFVILPPIDCGCPEINDPSNVQDAVICSDDPLVPISIDAAPDGYEVFWFNNANQDIQLATGNQFIPSEPGVYYAMYVSIANTECVSSVVAVELVEQEPIEILSVNAVCSADNLTYTIELLISGGSNANYTVSSSFDVTVISDNEFDIPGIPVDEVIQINITDEFNCNSIFDLDGIDCGCPASIDPIGQTNYEICDGDEIPTISVNAPPPNYIVEWHDQIIGFEILGTGENFTPDEPGNYYAVFVHGNSDCISNSFLITIDSYDPIVFLDAQNSCDINTQTYEVTLTISGGTGNYSSVNTDVGIVSNIGNLYTISNIPTDSALTISVEDDFGCEGEVVIAAVECDCPEIETPIVPNLTLLCSGDSFDEIVVENPNTNVNGFWYFSDDLTTVIETGDSFIPITAGNYSIRFSSLQEPNCFSDFTSFEIDFTPEVTVQIYEGICSDDLQTYDLSVQLNPAMIGYNIDGGAFEINEIGTGNYFVEDILSGDPFVFSVIDDNDCLYEFEIPSPSCNCPEIWNNNAVFETTICPGDAIPILTALPADPLFDVIWSSDAFGIDILDQGSNVYSPIETGTYFVAYFLIGEPNCMSSYIPFSILEANAFGIQLLGNECTDDQASYTAEVEFSNPDNLAFTLTSQDVVVIVEDNGTYFIEDIPNGTQISVDLTDEFNCVYNFEIGPHDCECPFIAAPEVIPNQILCESDSFEEIQLMAPSLGFEYEWYSEGAFIQIGSNFLPNAIGLYEVLLTDGTCSSAFTSFDVAYEQPITASISNQECNTEETEYDALITLELGDALVNTIDITTTNTAANFEFVQLSDVAYQVISVLSGEGFNVLITSMNDCDYNIPFGAFDCDCPFVEAPIISAVDLCDNQLPYELSITNDNNHTIHWFDDANVEILEGNPVEFTSFGIYSVQFEDNGCFSEIVSFNVNELIPPLIIDLNPICNDDETYNLVITFESPVPSTVLEEVEVDYVVFPYSDEEVTEVTVFNIASGFEATYLLNQDCNNSFSFPEVDCSQPNECTELIVSWNSIPDYCSSEISNLDISDYLNPVSTIGGSFTINGNATSGVLGLTDILEGENIVSYQVIPPLNDPIDCEPVSESVSFILEILPELVLINPNLMCNDIANQSTLFLNDLIISGAGGVWAAGPDWIGEFTDNTIDVLNTDEGIYSFTYSLPANSEICDNQEETISVTVEQCIEIVENPLIVFPNAFSPNNDTRNDAFGGIVIRGELINYHLEIYDRWGLKVFETLELNTKWNGDIELQPAEIGVYVYQCQYQFAGKEEELSKGNITLLR